MGPKFLSALGQVLFGYKFMVETCSCPQTLGTLLQKKKLNHYFNLLLGFFSDLEFFSPFFHL